MLKLSWLGPPLVELDGELLHFETRKVQAFLAYLSLTHHAQSREQLATLFWPEFDPVHALANLRRTLGSLKRSLAPEYLTADREIIRWNDAIPVDVDVAAFQAGLQAVRSHPHDEDAPCPECIEKLEQVSSLYRGDFLVGLNLPDCPAFDDWQLYRREELKRDLAWVAERRVQGWSGRGEWERAVQAARLWVNLDRLDPTAQLALVDVYARTGQSRLAQRQIDEYTRLVKESFGQEPDEALREQFLQILRQTPASGTEPKHRPTTASPGSSILLKTKLYLPKVKPNRVNRLRLLSRLGDIYRYKLTLISAPAGFGKTTLLAEWAMQTEYPIGWISLDAGDNEPSRFLSYMCAALDSLVEGIADDAQRLLETPQPVPPQSVMTVLLNEIEKIDEPLVVVLDDFQTITSEANLDTIAYFLEYSPQNLHLVIATRADPPLPLSKLRAQGELLEIRTDDLRFSVAETDAFLNQMMDLEIQPDDVQTLAVRTEGWAVGLQMAGVSLQGSPDKAKFIQRFTGGHRFILDYLIEEVLNQQTEQIRDFLLKTSILDRLCGELCEYVVGECPEPAFRILEYLERSNLFLTPLDEERHWYRYHQLFAELLAVQLQRLEPQLVPTLYNRASVWYEKNGQINQAIEYALESKDFERTGTLVEKDAQTLIYRVNFGRTQDWIDRLPRQMVLSRPWIGVTQGWIWIVAGKIAGLDDWMDRVELNYRSLDKNTYSCDELQDMAANISSIRAYVAFFQGDLPRCLDLANLALQSLSDTNNDLRVRIFEQLAETHLMLMDLNKARELFHQVIELGIQIHDYVSVTTAAMRFYKTLRIAGKLNEAEEMIQRIMSALAESGQANSPIAGKPEICWGDLLRERGQVEAAGIRLDKGLMYSRQYNIPYDIITALVYKAKWLFSQKKWEEAAQVLDEAIPISNSSSVPPAIANSWTIFRAKVWLEQGDLQRVDLWLQEEHLRWDDVPIYPQEDMYIFMAGFLLRQGKLAEAESLLAKLAMGAEEKGRTGNLIQILLLQALCLDEQGRVEQALDILEKALHLAEPEKYQATFLDEGLAVCRLLQVLRGRELPQSTVHYVDDLIQNFQHQAAA